MRFALLQEFEYEAPTGRLSRWCFGGGDGSGDTTTTQVQELSPEQRQLLRPVIPIATQFAENPPQLFPRSGIVGFNPLEQQAQQQAIGLSGAQGALGQQGAGFSSFLMGPALDPRTNPGLQGAIDAATRPIVENLTQSILPNLRGEFSVLGQPGSSRAGIAEGLATQGALRSIGDVTANVVNPAFQAGLDASTRALALLPQTQTGLLGGAGTLSDVGGAQRALEQALLSEEIARFGAEQTLPFQAAREVAQLAFGAPGGGATATVSGAGGGVGSLQGAIGGAASGAAIGTALSPGIGTALGALLGGAGGFFFS